MVRKRLDDGFHGTPLESILRDAGATRVLVAGWATAAAGIVVGLVGAFLLTRVMASLLFEVPATDPVTYASVTLGLAAVAAIASYIPARRASKVDPVRALAAE